MSDSCCFGRREGEGSNALRVYLAAPLFTCEERAFNGKLAEILERVCCDVFLPQREVGLLEEFMQDGQRRDEAIRDVFYRDLAGVELADVLVAVVKDGVADQGVAFELGAAFALGKTCCIFERGEWQRERAYNAMIAGSGEMVTSPSELVQWIFAIQKPDVDHPGSRGRASDRSRGDSLSVATAAHTVG